MIAKSPTGSQPLPTCRQRSTDYVPPVRDRKGGRRTATGFTKAEWQHIERFAVSDGTSPSMVFSAGVWALLSRL